MSDRAATLTAWERWEMASLGTPQGAAAAAPVEPPAPPVFTPMEPVRLFDEAELDRLREQARQVGVAEGRAQGHAEGLAQGLAEGRLQGREAGLAQMQAQAEQLRALAGTLPAALRCAEGRLAQDILALALELARQLAGAALRTDPDCILAVVRDLLTTEPTLAGAPRLLLHPEDAVLVREHLGPELEEAGWTIHPDPDIARGGCLVRAATGELDATVQTRAQRVEAALACRLRAPAPDHA